MNSIEIKTALSESDLTAIINGVVDALMPRLNPKMEDDAKLKRADMCEIFGCHYSTLIQPYSREHSGKALIISRPLLHNI